ncbi:hypothetical protein CULT_870006 [[Clostridium] ultunense Esp]|uniref:urease accessory protein UreD n=1 Tax=Thermicanus aegyptius TaxID=94009 RepID=UPI0002B70166|nr:urease accessory protein UreD [Thermicanus aegyptius]CCQ98402.1 hypothetical protein CULT_870006 [[Clostridium] ultunense Esp]
MISAMTGSSMKGRIEATVELVDGISTVTEAYWQAPLKLSRPFNRNGAVHLIGMDACAGMLDGDEQIFQFTVGEGARLLFTTQSATKIHPSLGKGVRQYVKIFVSRGGAFQFFPEGNIPFHGSIFNGQAHIELEEGAKLAYLELWSAGRIGSGEAFQFQSWKQNVEIYQGGKFILWEKSDWNPGRESFTDLFHFGSYTQLGTLYLIREGLGQKEADSIAPSLSRPPERIGGVTLLPYGAGLGVKVLGVRRMELRSLLLEIGETYF